MISKDLREQDIRRLGNSRILPFLRKDLPIEQIDLVISLCIQNEFRTLGFMPERMSHNLKNWLFMQPQVKSGELSLAATSVSTAAQVYELQDAGVRMLFYAGNLEQIDFAQLGREVLFVPIVNQVEDIASKLEFLEEHRQPPVVKVFIKAGTALTPGVVRELGISYPSMKLVVFGGVSPDNLQDYLSTGVYAVGMGRALPDHLLDSPELLSKHMQELSSYRS